MSDDNEISLRMKRLIERGHIEAICKVQYKAILNSLIDKIGKNIYGSSEPASDILNSQDILE